MSDVPLLPKLLFFAPQTILPISRSGIQRVVCESAEALLPLASIEFVKWDRIEGQLRYFNAFDCEAFFRTKKWRTLYKPHPLAERRRYRFMDTIPAEEREATWLFMPEISYHLPEGKLFYRNVAAQAREHGVRTAAVFYDLIPITNESYREQGKLAHEIYTRDLLNVDLVLPISQYAADELKRYELEHFGIDEPSRSRLRRRIAAVPLAEEVGRPSAEAPSRTSGPKRDVILLLGTVEPRKQQTKVLRVLREKGSEAARKLKVVVVGSLHPKSAEEFRALLASCPNVEYRGYLSDQEIDELWDRTRFSVFASNDEGFGLPICESLARGVPCLTADFGAMREVASGGGCVLVDVNSDNALAGGLARLAGDDGLVQALRDEIGRRRLRTWKTYATEVLAEIEESRTRFDTTAAFESGIKRTFEDFDKTDESPRWLVSKVETTTDDGDTWAIGAARGLTAADARAFADAVAAQGCDHVVLRFAGAGTDLAHCDGSSLNAFFAADYWSFGSKDIYESLVRLAAERGFAGLLPSRCLIGASAGTATALAGAVGKLRREIERRMLVARRETVFAAASRRDANEPGLLLQIVISTYNRGPFVAENVRWLVKHIEPLGGRVRLAAVDNASTDDTAERLDPFRQHPLVNIVRNVSNVGMLGNLQVCSTLLEADYTWVIGDDDFITPGTVDSVLAALADNRGLPFVFINFGVYGRAALGPGDSAETLIQNPTLLTTTPSKSGVYPVRDIALEHDNLFTAIYPIVFRTDVLSACFNYPFTGTPFSSLVESIPTTKLILETYGDAPAYWYAPIGIVGNAHNSWQKYRVQWHGVLMPLAFALAREARVDRTTLLEWSLVHENLFDDAVRLFPGQRLADHFCDDDLETSFRVFRKRLQA